MTNKKVQKLDSNPCWVSYISPFTLIVPDGEEPLNVDLKEINSNTYDHGKLCRIVKKYDLDESMGLGFLICYDGAIAVPSISKYEKKENVALLLNQLLTYLILSGFYCEAVDARDITWGQLYESKMIWPVNLGNSASSVFHGKLRMRLGNGFESIVLANPKYIYISQLTSMFSMGKKILSLIPNLTPTFLIRGITELKFKNWSLALSNLWITIEQITDYLWTTDFLLSEKQLSKSLPGRYDSLKKDKRTWSTSVKQEMLFQKGIITETDYLSIFPARQARNKLVHEGANTTEDIVFNLYDAIFSLLSKATKNTDLLIKNDQLQEKSLAIGNSSEKKYEEWKALII